MKSLALILLAAAVPALAAPINYDITFVYTGSTFTGYPGNPIVAGLAAPSGSFTYDPGSGLFTNFIVNWGNATYDVTSSANSPLLAPSPATGCTSADPTQPYGFALISQNVAGCSGAPAFVWTGTYYGTGFSTFLFINEVEITPLTVAQDEIGGTDTSLSDPSVYYEVAEGSWSLTELPEPGTLVTMLLGALAFAGVKAARRARG
jgi:hypothetical protein